MATITGNNQANILVGGPADDLIRGKGGNDDISGGAGNDRLKGGGGNDIIKDGEGADRMWGGNGNDIFQLVGGDGERERILDWQDGQDTLDLSDWGVTDIADLTFTELSNGQIRISFGAEEVQIKGKGGVTLVTSDFDPSDFIFATPTPPQVIDFETLSITDPQFGAPIEFVDPGHEGFTWSQNFYFVEEDDLQITGRTQGSDNRNTSGNVFATNGFGTDVDFSATDNFDFEEFTAGAVYNDGLTLRVIGVDNGSFVGDQLFTLNTTGSTQIQLDDNIFDSVDQVVFQSFGGTLNPAYPQVASAPDTTHFYIDDLIIG